MRSDAPDSTPPARTVGAWLHDIEDRLRRLEKLHWGLIGAFVLMQFLRACA